ncbi:tetratricopeptide repeat protein (macronuclear) [Tetrahymena thermophila SB210]|uniref:Tetratricopeptide repeat protein n=1 Tax=Tetrahymena thermophila (strain SB210) TaxID=312017 RepID=Q245R7_TETTS|nr:tetratricopeptide repeat protein [Tetrahymena thermophila SB210]EAS03566.2 tetratricopeptide repeat protein [Tetrahymena thermophila SB210]|eukprot:XP_001023811.2 tetratricopeptide repeat protein [Tetrahymena thermophila SB210]
MMNGKVNTNPKFISPLLNVYDTYNNIGDQYLLNLYKFNSSYLISSWHSKDTHKLQDLPQLSFDQVRNSSFIDFIWKAVLYEKRKSYTQPFVNVYVKLYFMAFSSDGMFYGSGINMTYSNIIDPYPCPKSKFNLDSRCQEYFQMVTQMDQLQLEGYIPTHFLYDINNEPYTALGLCKKIFINQNLKEKYNIPLTLNTTMIPFSIVCNSVDIEKKMIQFQNVGNQSAIRILIDPYKNRVAYQSDIDIQKNTIITLEESYLTRLQSDEQKSFFLNQVNLFKRNNFKRFCTPNKEEVFFQQSNQNVEQFTISVQNQKIIVIQQFTFYIDKIFITQEDGSIQVQYCFESSLLLLTILTQNQLQSFYYSQKISIMIGNSLEHLTIILKKLKVDQETKNFILFEDGMLSGDFQIDHSELLFSSDLSLLYESFQNLFQTLIYTTQSLFDQDESLTLINLTKQVSYFQQFKNYRALGICYNNIANIHFNNNRFVEALENYSSSIVCCNYELKVYQLSSFQNPLKNVQELNQNKEKKSRNSVFEFFLQKINSISIFKSKIDQIKNEKLDFKCQDDLLMNFQKYGIYEIQIEKKELQQMLFNRKYNFVRALIFHTFNQKKFLLFTDILEDLVNELVNLRSQDRIEGFKQKILLNQLFQCIYFNQQEQQKCESIVQENHQLYQQIKQISILKPQNCQSSKQKSQRIQDRKESQQTNNLSQFSPQLNQSNYFMSTRYQMSSKTQTKNTPQSQQNQQTEFNSKQVSFIKPLNSFPENTKDQDRFSFNTNSPLNSQQYLSFNKLIRENTTPLEIQKFESIQENQRNQHFLEMKDEQSKNTKTDNFDSPKITQQQASPKSNYFQIKSINSFQSPKINQPSLLKTNQQNSPQLNQSDQLKVNTFSSPKQNQSTPRASNQKQSLNVIQSLQKYFTNNGQNNPQNNNPKRAIDTRINLKHFQKFEKMQLNQQFSSQNNQQKFNKSYENYKQLDSLIKSKKQQINNKINGHDEDDFKMQNNNFNQNDYYSEKDDSCYSSFLSCRSKAKLHYDSFGSDRNQYYINEDQIFNLVQEQISMMYLLQKDYYKAAKAITKMYEQSKLVISQQFSRNIQRLLGIFDAFKIDCPFLDQIYKKLTQNTSFKICVVSFYQEQEFASQGSKTELDPSDSFQIFDQKNFSKESNLLDLLLDIIEQVVIKEDDYFGFISSNLSDMSITEHISVINNIQVNQQVIMETLCDLLNQKENKNSKTQKQKTETQTIQQQKQQMEPKNENLFQKQLDLNLESAIKIK